MSKTVGGNPKKAEKKSVIAVHSTIEKRKLNFHLNSQGSTKRPRGGRNRK